MNMTAREYARYTQTSPSVIPKDRKEAGLRKQCLACGELISDLVVYHACDMEAFE